MAFLHTSSCHAVSVSTAFSSIWALVVQDLAQCMKQSKACVLARADCAAACGGGHWNSSFCLALLASLSLLAAHKFHSNFIALC